THDHADQTHGIDDLRVFAGRARRRIPAFMDAPTRAALTQRFGYIFESVNGYPALLDAHDLPPHGAPWRVDGSGGPIPVATFDQAHGLIRSFAHPRGRVASSPALSALDAAAFEALAGCELWIVDALRYTPHPTHAHLDKTLGWIARAGVRKAVLTNLPIDMDYKVLSAIIPPNVEVAFDGWSTRMEPRDA